MATQGSVLTVAFDMVDGPPQSATDPGYRWQVEIVDPFRVLGFATGGFGVGGPFVIDHDHRQRLDSAYTYDGRLLTAVFGQPAIAGLNNGVTWRGALYEGTSLIDSCPALTDPPNRFG